jgi:hypothetical protein
VSLLNSSIHHPLLDIPEADLVGDFEHNDDTQSSSVTTGQDWSVSLLTTLNIF